MEVDYEKLVQGWNNKTYQRQSAGVELKEVRCLDVKSIDVDKRQITACASAGTIDRDGEIIEPSAFKKWLPVYMENPVVITSHLHRLSTGHSSVVGNVVDAHIDKKGLWVVIEFVKGTILGEEYWQLYSQKKQRALSVGFAAKETKRESRDGQLVTVITEAELFEISCVVIPSCREALTRSAKKKQAFVLQKKHDAEEEKILAELRAEDPDFDKKAEEWAEYIMDADLSGEVDDEPDHPEQTLLPGKAKASSKQRNPTLAKSICSSHRELAAAFGDDDLYRKYLGLVEQPTINTLSF